MQINCGDVTLTDEVDMANAFNAYFQSNFTVKQNTVISQKMTLNVESHTPGRSVSEQGILSLLLNLDTKKAPGPDKVSNCFLKRYAEWVAKYSVIIYSVSLLQCQVATYGLGAKVIPIPKTENKPHLKNYRLISLTSTCCKLT